MATDEGMDDRELNAALDEDIGKTYREIQARGESESAPADTEAPAASSPQTEDQPAADTRARDETGKFIAQPKATEQPAAHETVPQPSSETETPAPVAAAPTDQVLSTNGTPLDLNRPPSSWKPAAKAAWATLTPEVRSEIYRREGDFLKGNSGIKADADFGQTIRQKFEPYRMLLEAEGATPEQGIESYLKTAAIFRVGTPEQKMNTLYQLDQQFDCGFKAEFERQVQAQVAQLTGQQAPAPAAQPQQQFHDPRVDALLRSQEEQQQRQAAQLSAQAADAETKFRNAADEKGQPKYPFVDNVQDDMIRRIPEIRQANPALSHFEVLDRAYDIAVWANPETRAVLQSQQAAQVNQPAANQLKVEAARRASAVNVPKRGALPATGPAKSLEESIRETAQSLGMF